jgi:hypothetical protein
MGAGRALCRSDESTDKRKDASYSMTTTNIMLDQRLAPLIGQAVGSTNTQCQGS